MFKAAFLRGGGFFWAFQVAVRRGIMGIMGIVDIVDIVDGAVICFLKFCGKHLHFPESCFKDCPVCSQVRMGIGICPVLGWFPVNKREEGQTV